MDNKPKVLILYENKRFQDPIKYTFSLIMSILGLDYKIIQTDELDTYKTSEILLLISYGKEKSELNIGNQIHIYESDFFGENYLKLESFPKSPLERHNDLPIIYQGVNKIEKHVKRENDLIETDIDIIASSLFMVSRYEEVILKDRDKYGRFPATASLAYKEKFLDKPIVNEYIELFWSWIDSFDLGLKRKKLWKGKDFVVCLTHDVDEIKRYRRPPLLSIVRSIKQKDIKKAVTIFFDYLKTKLHLTQDPYYKTFDYIINLEKKYGFRSSFYFMTNGKTYSLNDSWLKKLILKLKKEGFDVGIHPSFNAYNNADVLKIEKEKLEEVLGREIIGGRQHYLKWNTPKTWNIWEKSGLKYDTTLGYADHEGFRCGICSLFRPFDVIRKEIIDIWEVPLIVMDGMLIGYRKLSPDESLKIMVNLLKTVEKYNGVFVLLWHNLYMTKLFDPEWKKCFEKSYKIISQMNCSVLTIREIIK